MTSTNRTFGTNVKRPKTIIRQYNVRVPGKGTIIVRDSREGKKPISRREKKIMRHELLKGQVLNAQYKYNQKREKKIAQKALKDSIRDLKCRSFLFRYIRGVLLDDYEAYRDTQVCVTKCCFYYQVILPNGNVIYEIITGVKRT